MTSAPGVEGVRTRLQAVQDELARKHNVAIAIRDRTGQPLTSPSKSLVQTASLSATALQGLYHCLSANWLLRDEEVLQGQRLVATLFSGAVTLAALPVFDDSQVAAVVRVAQTFGEVRRQLELLNAEVVASGGVAPAEDFLDPVDLHPGPEFVAMLDEIEAAVTEALGVRAPVPPPMPAPFPERLLDLVPIGAFIATIDWQVMAANPALASMLGYGEGQGLVGRNLLGEVLDLEFLPLVEELQGKGQIVERQANLLRADGKLLPVVLTMAMGELGGGQTGYWGFVHRKEGAAEAELWPNVLQAWPFPAVAIDRAQKLVECNQAALAAFPGARINEPSTAPLAEEPPSAVNRGERR